MNITFKWHKVEKKIIREALNGDECLLFTASEAKRLMEPYVPADNLVLSENTDVYVEGDSGIVEYLSPYAHYQYEGELYVSSVTGSPWARKGEHKVAAGKKLKHSTFRHPLATSFWDRAMKVARMDDLIHAVQQYLKR